MNKLFLLYKGRFKKNKILIFFFFNLKKDLIKLNLLSFERKKKALAFSFLCRISFFFGVA